MEGLADAVAVVLGHGRVPVRLGHVLTGGTNFREAAARVYRINRRQERLSRGSHEAPRFDKVRLAVCSFKLREVRHTPPIAGCCSCCCCCIVVVVVVVAVANNDSRAIVPVLAVQKATDIERHHVAEL